MNYLTGNVTFVILNINTKKGLTKSEKVVKLLCDLNFWNVCNIVYNYLVIIFDCQFHHESLRLLKSLKLSYACLVRAKPQKCASYRVFHLSNLRILTWKSLTNEMYIHSNIFWLYHHNGLKFLVLELLAFKSENGSGIPCTSTAYQRLMFILLFFTNGF